MKSKSLQTIAIVLALTTERRAQEPPREALDGTDPVLLVPAIVFRS